MGNLTRSCKLQPQSHENKYTGRLPSISYRTFPGLEPESRSQPKDMETLSNNQIIDYQKQMFRICRGYITNIKESQCHASHPVISRRLEWTDSMLASVSTFFCSMHDTLDEVSYLLVHILHRMSESLYHYLQAEASTPSESAEDIALEYRQPSEIGSHKEIFVLFGKILQHLDLSESAVIRIEEYMFQLQTQIEQSTNYTSLLEQAVSAAELWVNQLLALLLFRYPRNTERKADPIRYALQQILGLMRDIQ